MAISKKIWLGIAREAVAGTSLLTPSIFMPATVKMKNVKKRIYFNENRNTRDGNNSVVDGTRHNEGEIGGAWYNDSSPYFLLGFMGAVTSSQPASGTDPTVWQHAMSLTDNPLPLDFWLGYDSDDTGFAYQMAYNVVKSVKFKWQAGESSKEFGATFGTLGQPFTKITTGLGAAPATPVPTTSGTGGTVAAGVYKVIVTYVYSNGESAPSASGSITTTGSTSTITVPSPAAFTSPIFGAATGFNIYMTQVGGSTYTKQGGTNTLGTPVTISAPPTSSGSAQPANLLTSYSTLNPLPGYAPQIQLSGVQSNDIEEMEIDLEQKYTLFSPSNGSPAWVTAYPGERTAKVSFTARFDTDTLYQKYNANTGVDDSLVVTVNGPVISHAYTQQLVLSFPILGYDDMEMDSGKDNIQLKVKATARPGSAVNSLFTATVQNTVNSYAS